MKNQILLFVLAFSMQIMAQESHVSGVVTDTSNTPIPGVNVMVKGSSKGTQTDFDGNYEITAHEGQTLVFSFVGYQTKEVKIGGSTILNVQLEESLETLEEVVVMGYGVKKEKRSLGYSVSDVVSGKASGLTVSEVEDSERYGNYKPGTLTAGEINDIENFSEWEKVIKGQEFQKIKRDWGFWLENKLEVTVRDDSGKGLNNARVSIYQDNESSNMPEMTVRTDVFGKSVLFKNTESSENDAHYYVQVFHKGKTYGKKIRSNTKKVNFIINGESTSNNLDIMFTIDATGSMGDEMEYLKEELQNIIGRIDNSIGEKRVAMTFYRDQGDEYVVRDFDFTANLSEAQTNLNHQFAGGGGDYEEAVEKAMEVSMSKSWNIDARARLMFLLLDAPPHLTEDNIETIHQQIKKAQANGIKIIPVVASGADKTVEMLMRFFSISTNGTYVFLTDDSGVGNKHLKPSTSKYKVEKLNDLIVRLIEKYASV